MEGGANKLHSLFFCSECKNLYDITSDHPEDVEGSDENVEKKKSKSKIPEAKKIYFVCKTCGNTEEVRAGTMIMSKKSEEIAKQYSSEYVSAETMTKVSTLPHTRDYICPNKTCKTHAKPEMRDAVMTRIGNTMAMKYICTICNTMWK